MCSLSCMRLSQRLVNKPTKEGDTLRWGTGKAPNWPRLAILLVAWAGINIPVKVVNANEQLSASECLCSTCGTEFM